MAKYVVSSTLKDPGLEQLDGDRRRPAGATLILIYEPAPKQ